MDIKLGIGLDNIIFGSTESEIEEILGKPDRIRMDEEYEEFEPMLQFNSIKTRLTFYKNHGGKLGYMRSSNPDLSYKNKKIIGKSISEAFDGHFNQTNKTAVLHSHFQLSGSHGRCPVLYPFLGYQQCPLHA